MNTDALRSLTQIAGNTEVVSVFGELDEASGKIVLFDDSCNDHDRKDIGIRLSVCTPKFSPTKDGPLLVPCSWEAVTQIVHSFPDKHRYRWCPGPKLSAWLVQEIIRRSCQGDLLGEKPSREPMAHQSAGAIAIGMNGRFLLADEPGAGKTAAALMGLAELEARHRNPWPVLVVCPAAVIDPWLEEAAIVYPAWNVRAYRGPNRKKLLGLSPREKLILVMSYETMRNDMGDAGVKSVLETFKPGTIVSDECVPYDTLIKTPSGSKRVSNLRKGDLVRGVNRRTGRLAWTPVLGVSRSPIRDTVRIGDLNLTPNHPVWIADASSNGIWYARSCEEGLRLCSLREDIYPGALSESHRAEVLLPGMHEDGACSAHRHGTSYAELPAVRSVVREQPERGTEVLLSELRVNSDDPRQEGSHAGGDLSGGPAREHDEGEHLEGSARIPEFGQEPVQGAGRGRYPHEGPCTTSCCWLADADGREWHGTYYPAGDALEAAGRGIHPRVLNRAVQGGSSASGAEASNRGGRAVTHDQEAEGHGRGTGREAGVTWLDDASIPERGDPSRSLWNIETGTGNYVAANVLTHNCHKLCNHDTKQSVRMRRLAKKVPNFIGASGTPITKNAGNFWPILFSMFPESYPDRERYNIRYTNINPYANDGHGEIGGLNPLREPEFRDVMRGTMRRVAKSDVLKDLPPKTYQTRWTDIPPKWRKAYDEMEEDMLAHLPDAEHQTPLEAMSSLAKMTRLRQLANSACDVEVIESNEWDELAGDFKREIRVHPKEPCWKGDMLLEIMEELHQDDAGSGIQHGHRPVIAFAPYRKLVMLAGGMAERKGYKVGYIVGGMTDAQRTAVRHEFQAGKLDLIGVSTGAGGAGLTLTAADTVVFLARPWGMVEATQAEDRAHRAGQLKHVQIVDLEARNSVESRVRAALKDKMRNLSELVNDTRMVKEFLGG